MLSLAYLGMNLIIVALAVSLLMLLGRLKAVKRQGLFYHVSLVAILMMVLQETPFAFGKVGFYGEIYFLLTVLLATVISWCLLRTIKTESSFSGFKWVIIVGLWLFLQQFFALIPHAMMAM